MAVSWKMGWILGACLAFAGDLGAAEPVPTDAQIFIEGCLEAAKQISPLTVVQLDLMHKAEVVEVYDGDTITGRVRLAFATERHPVKFRLFGIQAPEVRTSDAAEKARGLEARTYLTALIGNETVIVQTLPKRDGTEKTGKYGRYLAIVWLCDPSGACLNVNHDLVRKGYAVFKDY